MKIRIAIIGAGPIGLEAALAAMARGYEVEVFERGQIADSVRAWGHVRMFSPFSMNSSPEGRARIDQQGLTLPEGDALLTGAEFAQSYLVPLGESLRSSIHINSKVIAIGREGVCKTDKIGLPTRAEAPFRLLIHEAGQERYTAADLVLDCSGTFRSPNPLGDGGIPALGETALRDRRISYGVPDAGLFAGRRMLVVGGGHSAATVARDLSRMADVKLTWAIRKPLALPCQRIPNDSLLARDQLSREANDLAAKLDFRSGTSILSLKESCSGVAVILNRGGRTETLQVDHVIATTGFRPDPTLARELQVQTCWATEGAYRLAAQLLGEEAGDCLVVPANGVETLLHPEPGYFTLGMKSYGRMPDFLIRTGRQQISAVLEYLEK